MAKRYQRGKQNPYIEEEQTAQWPKDTKEVNRIRISKKNRQHNGQKKRYKRTSNDLQSIHIKQTNTNATNNPGWTQKGKQYATQLVTLVADDTNIIWYWNRA
jgi:hypothetical protein